MNEISPGSSSGNNNGFERDCSVGEEELEAFNAPEVAVDEERKLREERERREEKKNEKVDDGENKAVLEQGKYAQVRMRERGGVGVELESDRVGCMETCTSTTIWWRSACLR